MMARLPTDPPPSFNGNTDRPGIRIVKDNALQRRVSQPAIRYRHIRRTCAIDRVLFAIKYRNSGKIEHLKDAIAPPGWRPETADRAAADCG